MRFLHEGEASPPFSEEDIQPFRDLLSQFLEQNHQHVSWEIREDQPLHLSILQQMSVCMKDADTTLFPALQDGVSTGFDGDIAPSSCFPVASSTLEDPVPLSIHMTNWQSAENDLETTRNLVQQELDKGWIYKYPGTIAEAQAEFGEKLAVGRLGLALSDSRLPRLVVDSSICGLNSQITIPERTTIPSALDVLRVYPLRNVDDSPLGFSLDVKSAHKLVVLRKSEQGLVGFSLDGSIYFYKVCPFGASFSASPLDSPWKFYSEMVSSFALASTCRFAVRGRFLLHFSKISGHHFSNATMCRFSSHQASHIVGEV